MTPISRKCAAWAARFALAALAVGCGGRTNSETSGETDTAADGGTTPTGTPVPTCTEICNHVVGVCAAGASIDTCSQSCEAMRTSYAGCKELEMVLRCMPTAEVQCVPGEAKIVGCGTVLGKLEECHH
jgi:hypothetical protein